MAGIDALLSLVLSQGADRLRLSTGEVPALEKGGAVQPLSMPPLPEQMFERLSGEVRDAAVDGVYRMEARDGEVSFGVLFDEAGSLELVCGGAAPSGGGAADGPVAEVAGAEGPSGDLRVLWERAIAEEAIDLFLSTSAPARLRVGRELREVPGTRCAAGALFSFLGLDTEQQTAFERSGNLDLAIEIDGERARVNVFRHRDGVAAALRPIRRRIRSLAELSLPADLSGLVEPSDGLVLFVGPTGSGKSSTLAALIEHINETRSCHIVTIEDPVEFRYEPRRALIHQRELGADVGSFADGLRAALREGPDVILLGEMRDPETIAAALTAAETGHLVLSTLHAGHAAMAIDRIVDAFPPHRQAQVRWQLAGVLRSIVTQVLVPAARSEGWMPAMEKMLVTPAVAANIREGRGHQIASQIQTGREEGMLSLELSLAGLVRRGLITPEAATRAARNPDLLRRLLLDP